MSSDETVVPRRRFFVSSVQRSAALRRAGRLVALVSSSSCNAPQSSVRRCAHLSAKGETTGASGSTRCETRWHGSCESGAHTEPKLVLSRDPKADHHDASVEDVLSTYGECVVSHGKFYCALWRCSWPAFDVFAACLAEHRATNVKVPVVPEMISHRKLFHYLEKRVYQSAWSCRRSPATMATVLVGRHL